MYRVLSAFAPRKNLTLLGCRFLSSAPYAQQTIYTGLKTEDNVIGKLRQAYKQIDESLKLLPSEYFYRQQMEATVKDRLNLLSNEHITRSQLEESFGEDILEVVLDQTNDELCLIQKMQEWKPWEPLAEQPPTGQWDSTSTIQ